MVIYFITGNKNKFAEAKAIIPELEQLEIDLPEIQEFDARRIIDAKLREACKHHNGEFIVEDTSLYIDGLNGLPGPLIKWFLQTLKNEGIADVVGRLDTDAARATTWIGYARSPTETRFFEGTLHGRIVPPRGQTRFGWDPVFLPTGSSKTFAEMTPAEKHACSMRAIAFNKLKEFRSKETAERR